MSDAAVKAKTGRAWPQWVAVLDRAGAEALDHKGIVDLVHRRFGVDSGWWCQMVTVGYERAKGRRAMYQKADGYSANASLTIASPVADVFAAWNDTRRRRAWLPDPITIRKSTPDKSLRITWVDGTNVEAYLVAKGAGKTQVAVQHSKLAGAAAVAMMKVHWKDALARLAAKLA